MWIVKRAANVDVKYWFFVPSIKIESKFKLVSIVVLVCVALDQITKFWALNSLKDNSFFFFNTQIGFSVTTNSGSAFSLFESSTLALSFIAVVLGVGLAIGIYKSSSIFIAFSLALILSGAIGNFIDRLFQYPYAGRGHVTDFIKVYSWPTFNIADSCICIGAVLLIASTMRKSK